MARNSHTQSSDARWSKVADSPKKMTTALKIAPDVTWFSTFRQYLDIRNLNKRLSSEELPSSLHSLEAADKKNTTNAEGFAKLVAKVITDLVGLHANFQNNIKTLKDERDEARRERDEARKERNEARQERDRLLHKFALIAKPSPVTIGKHRQRNDLFVAMRKELAELEIPSESKFVPRKSGNPISFLIAQYGKYFSANNMAYMNKCLKISAPVKSTAQDQILYSDDLRALDGKLVRAIELLCSRKNFDIHQIIPRQKARTDLMVNEKLGDAQDQERVMISFALRNKNKINTRKFRAKTNHISLKLSEVMPRIAPKEAPKITVVPRQEQPQVDKVIAKTHTEVFAEAM
jgi:hypothetical protein